MLSSLIPMATNTILGDTEKGSLEQFQGPLDNININIVLSIYH